MDDFILKNDAWLKYLPIIIYALVIFIVAFLIVIGFLIYIRYKNQNLKSRKSKSPFALAYADSYSSNVTSSSPLKRNDFSHADISDTDTGFENIRPANPIPIKPVDNQSSRVLEFYFEYEDEYKI